MGTGHLARCLSLADAFAERGAKVRFLTRDFDPSVPAWLRSRGHEAICLPRPGPSPSEQDFTDDQEKWLGVPWERDAEDVQSALGDAPVDLLVANHYGIDHRWESSLRTRARKLMVIDDGGSRRHDCDVLLDQNLHGSVGLGHERRVPAHCNLLLGPRYALLRPEFRMQDSEIRKREGTLAKILVFFGGSDPTNETGKALEGLRLLGDRMLETTVVAGALNPHFDELEAFRKTLPGLVVHKQVDYMARLMQSANLGIGAGGITTWERCRMGLPSLVAILADNQAEIAAAVAATGAQANLGWSRDLGPGDYAAAIGRMDGKSLRDMSLAGMRLVDGKGCERVVQIMGNP